MSRSELINAIRELSTALQAATDGSCGAASTQHTGYSARDNDDSSAATTVELGLVALSNHTVEGSIRRATEFDANDGLTTSDYDSVYPSVWRATAGAADDLAPLSQLSLPNAEKLMQVQRDEATRHAALEAEKAEDAHAEKRIG